MRQHIANSAGACARKCHHRDFNSAMAECRKSNADPTVKPYRCAHCGHWHVGHNFGWSLKREFQGARR